MDDDGWPEPIDECPLKVVAALFDPATGVRWTVKDNYPADYGFEALDYLWTDGNYACDCNRRLFLHRAGAPGYSEETSACGDTIKLESLKLEDGTDVLAATLAAAKEGFGG